MFFLSYLEYINLIKFNLIRSRVSQLIHI